MGVGEWGIGDGGLAPTPNPQSPIPNPQFILYLNHLNIIINQIL